MKRILIVEDEEKIARFIELELQLLSDTEIRCCEAVVAGCDE